MEFLTEANFRDFVNPGVVSRQLLSPHNSRSSRVTITHVTVEPGGSQPRHAHPASEQIWIALSGEGMLLLDQDETLPFRAGQVVRFEEGDVHGLQVTGAMPFIYMSVTSPPLDFSDIYESEQQ
ncbi:cupin domain-containing protein [Nitrincola alkalilacustris]|uniref:cupin domain-containing protein n=1 Tax=Nitrincola alkalilacustris TaxID=1571224 RepID=UPI00124DF969|nr:cupin domain-containing protein [Nitrincola alkalilacustris]